MTTDVGGRDYSADFGPFRDENGERIWLDAAHQGPLPRVAVAEAKRALDWKISPHRLADAAFIEVPLRLRAALGRLIGAPAEDIILGNSASYGLHVLANGLRWREGDEVVVIADDFPATIFPWFVAERFGVRVRKIDLDGPLLRPSQLERELTDRTRVVSVTWVRSLTGHVLDLDGLGRLCADAGSLFVVNATQGVGNRPLDVHSLPIAALTSSGFKWLCGPYGTGFAWIRPDVLRSLERTQSYWLARPDGTAIDLNVPADHPPRDDLGARAYDVFGTANFLNFMPWTAAVEYLLQQGIEATAAHDASLVDLLIEGLGEGPYRVVGPTDYSERSAIVSLTHEEDSRNAALHQELSRSGIDGALRGGNLRFSPHLYNTPHEIERTLEVLVTQG
jgi:selenocysteine lyase/cysteine desulfurase